MSSNNNTKKTLIETLTIIGGSHEGSFDDMTNLEDCSWEAFFVTKEKGRIEVVCKSVAIFKGVSASGIFASNDFQFSAEYDPETETGLMQVFALEPLK